MFARCSLSPPVCLERKIWPLLQEKENDEFLALETGARIENGGSKGSPDLILE